MNENITKESVEQVAEKLVEMDEYTRYRIAKSFPVMVEAAAMLRELLTELQTVERERDEARRTARGIQDDLCAIEHPYTDRCSLPWEVT